MRNLFTIDLKNYDKNGEKKKLHLCARFWKEDF